MWLVTELTGESSKLKRLGELNSEWRASKSLESWARSGELENLNLKRGALEAKLRGKSLEGEFRKGKS